MMETSEHLDYGYGAPPLEPDPGYLLPQLFDVGPPPPPPQLYLPHHQSSCSTTYDMTAADSGVHAPPPPAPPPPPLPPSGPTPCGSVGGGGESDTASVGSRRRKCASGSDYDDDTGDDRSQRTSDGKKQNHSEIEKRRRDKMNTYITELSGMVPMCGAMARKLDKLTVLRMAVQHLKRIRGAAHAFPEGRYKPAFLSERELKMLMLQAAEGFLFVADCDRGRVLYVSESVSLALHYTQAELLGQSLFDILHPKDVAKVKEQLSSSDLSPRERLIDAKTMLPVVADVVTGSGASRLCPGARRSFFCRMKSKPGARHVKDERDRKQNPAERKYCVVQCTGYLKAWTNAEMGAQATAAGEESNSVGGPTGGAVSCLVAVGRTMPELPRCAPAVPLTRRLQFLSRHATDGKFVYVDQRATLALGFLPQELLGTSIYEYCAPAQVAELTRVHKAVLVTCEPQTTCPYVFRRKDGFYARLQTDWRPFRNPWTKELECLVANNTLLELYVEPPVAAPATPSRYYNRPEDDVEMQHLIHCQLESHKIGSAIAEEVLRGGAGARGGDSASTTPDILHDIVNFTQNQVCETEVESEEPLAHFSQVRNNVPLSAAAVLQHDDQVLQALGESVAGGSAGEPPPPPDGNDEAAMAVIMSLLEADAGLGGPVDFSGLPWPLP